MKKYYAVLVVLFMSCNNNNGKIQSQNDPVFPPKADTTKKEIILFKDTSDKPQTDKFGHITVNGLSLETTKKIFLKKHPHYDSIDVQGFYCFGKSRIHFDTSEVDFIQVLDSNLYFDNYLNIHTSMAQIKSMFPYSYKQKHTDYFSNRECDIMEVHDEVDDRLLIYFNGDSLLAVEYIYNWD